MFAEAYQWGPDIVANLTDPQKLMYIDGMKKKRGDSIHCDPQNEEEALEVIKRFALMYGNEVPEDGIAGK
jgi:hypothetical protein